MRDAVIVEAVRTPLGKRRGALRKVHPVELSAQVLKALVARAGVRPEQVDDVIWGCVMQVSEQAGNIGRNAVLAAGWPESVPATTIDRQCGSSQQSAHFAAAGVMAGQYDLVIAGGVESMTRVPMGSARGDGGSPWGTWVRERYGVDGFNQGIGAEMLAKRWNISREQADQLSLESHRRAAEATDAGRFKNQITPVQAPDDDGNLITVEVDEGLRRGTSMEKMASLKPAFQDDGIVTAGNSSQISDGAAALLITTSEIADQLGLTPLVRFHSFSLAGVDPVSMLTGPIPATQKVLEKAGLKVDDIGAFEVNEAFATVIGAWLAEIGAPWEKVNPNGGAIAIGHPLGGSGARLMTTLVHHMVDNGIQYGLQTMCEGGGMANGTILELVR
jgi:acetyl-CoA acyltransferase